MDEIVIIGAGFSGLTTAAILSNKGFDVTVIEKNDQPGGVARIYEEKGYKFDMGPSWYLMPEVFEQLYEELGTSVQDELDIIKLDPQYRVFFEDETVDIPLNKKVLAEIFDGFEDRGAEKLDKYLEVTKYLYETASQKFLEKDLYKLSTLLDKQLIFEAPKLNLFENMKKYVSRYFASDKARKILLYNLVFLGADPKNTPALYSLMGYADLGLGVYYPKGGFHAVAQSIYKIAKNYGANFRFLEEVTGFKYDNAEIEKVVTSKGEYPSEIVLMAGDYHHCETELLEKKYRTYSDNYWKNKQLAPSAFNIYLGINKRIKNLEHHNLFFSKDWDTNFAQIFDDPQWPDDPSYYVCCPSKTEEGLAPKGAENVFILVPVSAHLQDDDSTRQKYTDKIINDLEKKIGERFSDQIIVKRIFSQKDFKQDYNAYKGTAFGLSHTLFQTAFFRPRNKSKKLSNLYYAGQYVHPGIGVPTTIISGKIAAAKIIKENEG